VPTTTTLRTAAALHYLEQLKDPTRGRATFRDALANVTTLLVAHALAVLDDPEEVVFVPVIRGGLGMVDGALAASPGAAVGHVGIYRDKVTGDIIEYYSRLPDHRDAIAVVLDPMVASGGTIVAAAEVVEQAGYRRICIASVVASAAGLEVLSDVPAVSDVVVVEVDDDPPGVGVLRNGLGDAGARLYGTA
jgi:uracil phosphoribosyltransferase